MIYTSFHIPSTYDDVITRSFNLILSAGVRAGRKRLLGIRVGKPFQKKNMVLTFVYL